MGWKKGEKRPAWFGEKISKAKKGCIGVNKGKKFSAEWCKNMSEVRKGKKMTLESSLKKREKTRGDKCYKWKGGVSRGYKTGYYSFEYRNWRMNVFTRDNFTCQGCKSVGGYLTAHHIKSFAHYPELRFVLDNGVTLCEECHKLTDNYKGRGKLK